MRKILLYPVYLLLSLLSIVGMIIFVIVNPFEFIRGMKILVKEWQDAD